MKDEVTVERFRIKILGSFNTVEGALTVPVEAVSKNSALQAAKDSHFL